MQTVQDQLSKRVRTRKVGALLVLLGVLVGGIVWAYTHRSAADSTALQYRVTQIGSELRAPADHNSMTVATSPIPQAQSMRFQIQQDVLKGMSNGQIIRAMVHQYGASVLAAPAVQGFGTAVWVIPGVAVVVGSLLYIRYLKRVNSNRTSQSVRDSVGTDSAHLEHMDTRLQDYL